MEENRKIIILCGIGLALLMGLIWLMILLVNPWEELQSLVLGYAIGFGLGIVISWFIYRTWDPVLLQFKNSFSASNGCLFLLIFIGITLAFLLIPFYFPTAVLDIFTGCIVTSIISPLFFLAILAWWHRPK